MDFGCDWSGGINVLPALAAREALRGLKLLKLRYAHYSDASVTALLASSHLAGLDAIRLDVDSGTPALARAVKGRLIARFGEEVFDDSIPF